MFGLISGKMRVNEGSDSRFKCGSRLFCVVKVVIGAI